MYYFIIIGDLGVENASNDDGMAATVVVEARPKPSPSFPFDEFSEDLQDLLVDRFLDLPTLLSLGYTSNAFLSRIDNVLRKSGGKARLRSLYSDVAALGYFELFKFFILEIPPRSIPGFSAPGDLSVVSNAIEHGHVQFVRSLMTIRDDRFAGFSCGDRMDLPASFNSYFVYFLPLSKSNSPAMFDFLKEAKIDLDLLSLAKSCIQVQSVDLLRHVFKELDVDGAFLLLTDAPLVAIYSGAICVLDLFINELKFIRVQANSFIVTFEGKYHEVLFESTWLYKNLLAVSTYLDHLGIEVTYSPQIGLAILEDGNPNFIFYLEQKGIDYRDLVTNSDFSRLFVIRPLLPLQSRLSFYNILFRDRSILEKFDGDLRKSLIRFLGGIAKTDPGMALPLVRWIYDESSWRHSLPHPFELVEQHIDLTEEVLRFCLDFSWTSEIDEISFFNRIRYLDASKQSSYVRLITDFIDLKQRDNSNFQFSAVIVRCLMVPSRLSLKTLHEILLILPLKNERINLLFEFLKLKCSTATEFDSFFSIVEWLESNLGFVIAHTPISVIPQILAMGNPKILSRLFDRGLPMISDASLAVLRNFKVNNRDGLVISSEVGLLGSLLEKLRLLKEHGAEFPKSLLCDAFTDLKSTNGLFSLSYHSEHIARIFDFLIDECGCPLHVNVLLQSLRVSPEGKVERDKIGIRKTIKYLCNRRCPLSDECYQLAIRMDERFGWAHFVDLLRSNDHALPPFLAHGQHL